jgi:hypothetical protein
MGQGAACRDGANESMRTVCRAAWDGFIVVKIFLIDVVDEIILREKMRDT